MGYKKVDYYKRKVKGYGKKVEHSWEKSQGIKWQYGGMDFFIEKDQCGYYILSEGRSGMLTPTTNEWIEYKTIKSIQEDCIKMLENFGLDAFKACIERGVEKYGLSPLYVVNN